MNSPVTNNVLLAPLLWLISLIYGVVVVLRLKLYDLGIKKKYKLKCKTISVGNITVGGSGKTPFTIMLAKILVSDGKKVCILSRGYKRKSKGIVVVSDYEKILTTVEDSGDEPYLMASKLKTVPVIVGSSRFESGKVAIEKFKPDVIILDDGYQHIQLKRDLNIMLVDGSQGFGKSLLPLGMLREPIRELKRAHIFFSKGSIEDKNKVAPLKEDDIAVFNLKPTELYNHLGEKITLEELNGKKVSILCAIANPNSFKATLKKLEVKIDRELIFNDHQWFDGFVKDEIINLSNKSELIVTTEKDFVKLKYANIEQQNIYALETEARLDGGLEKLKNLINA